MSQRIVLVRHGTTEWSAAGRHTSFTDIPLTDEGRRNASALHNALASVRADAVWSSPSLRAYETCKLAGFEHNAVAVADLVEWNYGEYEGRTTLEIRERRPRWSLWDDGAPGGETVEAIQQRADRLLATIQETQRDTLIFSHGHFSRVLAARWLGLPARDGRLLALDPATISTLGFERDQRVLTGWNASPQQAR